MEGLNLLKVLATTGVEAEFLGLKLEFLEYARKKTTQKVKPLLKKCKSQVTKMQSAK